MLLIKKKSRWRKLISHSFLCLKYFRELNGKVNFCLLCIGKTVFFGEIKDGREKEESTCKVHKSMWFGRCQSADAYSIFSPIPRNNTKCYCCHFRDIDISASDSSRQNLAGGLAPRHGVGVDVVVVKTETYPRFCTAESA